MSVDLQDLSRRLFKTAEQLWTNTALRPDQYAQPVLALIALRQMEARFDLVHAELSKSFTGRLKPTPQDYHGHGAIFLPNHARFSYLLGLPETENLAEALNVAMEAITKHNPDLAGVLPRGYGALPNSVLREILRLLSPLKIEGDAYGLIFEYFMGEFASAFMQKGGEYFTPSSIVKLIVEVIEPYHGKIFDPACGSGGMFVHSSEFVKRHHRNPTREISIYGAEKMDDTQKLCRLNLAVHGVSGDVRVANSYYEDPHTMVGAFDFVMANPPFNQSEVDRSRLVNDAGHVEARFSLGIPTVNNANYLWIGLFAAALNDHGRAGFVMANSASDAAGSEREMRRKLIETGMVDVIISTSPNMFFTVTLPVTLWFLDKGKKGTSHADEVLFIDARRVFRQVSRSQRDFTPDQIEFIGNIVRRWRGEDEELEAGSGPKMTETFGDAGYKDVPGLCKGATRAEIAARDWSLNPGRYVGVAPGQQAENEDFRERLEAFQEDLEGMNAEAVRLHGVIAANMAEVLS
ncbi:HsdM family class I SAM-dependent methyltransferase [Agrobacterium tumefaciens]|uniref:HsdM family class I SAM-dependent methyltransferase n=1 Tax=Agrobacterium tumefaciens TaxID=358 RepID=UPI001573449A|nr:class I SAM-dependent DNA methyltransferase [Agrobacterium tumefaciens]NTA18910.1 SAM-dependent DNA methyltransferase [Agrobacterium tumefaciens]WCK72392.1 class I SAM-dependent DNA methyltransferase [Agrobacterium tumefaciens]